MSVFNFCAVDCVCSIKSVCPQNAHGQVKSICDLQLCRNTDGLIDELVLHMEKQLRSIKNIK